MTMDPVFEQATTIQHQKQQQPAPPPPPPPQATHQHLFQHHTHQFSNHNHHHGANHARHNQNTTNQTNAPLLHRPVHPPPPPPPPNSQSQVANTNHIALSQPSETTSDLETNVLQIPTDILTGPIRPSPADYLTNYRNLLQQQNYYTNSLYQVYQPSSLQVHNNQRNQFSQQNQIYIHQQKRQNHNQEIKPRSNNNQLDAELYPQRRLTTLEEPKHVEADTSTNNVTPDQFTEEVIQAILAAKEALEKPIEERDDRDIMLIDNLCSLVHGFDAFPKTVRRALAAQAVLIVIDEKGKELIVHNEELDSFCVLIFGECEQLNVTKTVPVRTYRVGDSFGVCEPTTETTRFVGHMMTKCENCAFLCVKRDDFYTILTDPANYPNKEIIKHKDRNGNIVCVSYFDLRRKSPGPLWTNHSQSNNPFKIVLPEGHIIVKATESCLLQSLVDGYDKLDPEYVDDFLLLFRVFMTYDQKEKERKLPPGMITLCLALARWLDHTNYRDKVLESRLTNLSLNNQLHLLRVTLSTKTKVRQVIITRSSREQPLKFTISGGYEKNCGIFVTQVHGSNCDECPYESLMNYLKYPNWTLDSNYMGPPSVPPRLKSTQNQFNPRETKNTVALRPGDQILEVNGTNFAAIKLVEAQKRLDMSTHLSITVRYNPAAFNEMKALPEGRRKSSLSSMSSVSPYQPSTAQRFTFNSQEIGNNCIKDQYPPASPLFSTNANFGFTSIIKPSSKNDRSKLSSLIHSSRQFVRHMVDSRVQNALNNNFDTILKTSDNTSDDVDLVKSKSNSELPSTKNKLLGEVESGLSGVVRLDDLKFEVVTAGGNNNQMLINVLRVFNAANNDFRYLLIHEDTTAREVVMVAVKEFNLTANQSSPNDKSLSSLNWHLYEVSVVPESKTIKQKCLSEQTTKLAEQASLCSRFYIKNNSQNSFGPTRLDMGDDALVNDILRESPTNITLTSLNATLLAVELTLADFDKFKSIEPQQFVYDTFFDYSDRTNHSSASGSSSADSASLKSSSSDGQEMDILHAMNKSRVIPKNWMREYQDFADISNKEMFWVVCEILNERNISRRVKIVKQFIRVADVCSQLRNYNSMFAIISGLGHSCVNRLKRTFEKLKPKYKNQLEKMRGLFDPSKNMSIYRSCLNETRPPAIPLFPQIKKDLTFTKEGRSIFVRESCGNSSDEEEFGDFSQDTIKRKSGENLLSCVKSSLSMMDTINFNHNPTTRSISYSSFNNNNNSGFRQGSQLDSDNILVNFAEIRQFTERVRNVTHYSSIPYSYDLLTNNKDNRNQAQIKKMHEEWQMRKRIRHYLKQTLDGAIIGQHKQLSTEKLDEVDSSLSKNNAKLNITYDEKTLYQRSLDVEPELNGNNRTIKISNSSSDRQFPTPTMPLYNSSLSQATTVAVNMHIPMATNSSPTLSKSSSLSSCSSFNNHHLPNIHVPRGNLNSTVGKFGTESTESLRKLRALSENVDDWKPYHGRSNGASNIINNNVTNCTTYRVGGDSTSHLLATRLPKSNRN